MITSGPRVSSESIQTFSEAALAISRWHVQLALGMVFLAALAMDQISKEHVQQTMIVWENPENTSQYRGARKDVFELGSMEVEPGRNPTHVALNWQYSRNKGAAFSMLANLPDNVRVPFFFIITILAVLMIAYYLKITPLNQALARYGLALILSGAIGNFVDRLRHGYVVDFIAVEWDIFGWQHDFAIFNVADICINIGVACLLIDMLMQARKKPVST